MNTRSAVVMTVLALATAGPVIAQSAYLWEQLGTDGDLTISYNPLTVRHNNGVVTFLEKVAYGTPAPLPNGTSVSYYTVDMTIDCAASTYSHSNFTAYSAEGTVIPNVSDSTPAGMNPITPDGGAPAAFKTKFCT